MNKYLMLPAVIALGASTVAFAETSPPATTGAAPSPAATTEAAAPTLTDEQVTDLKNKVVYSSDDKNVGEVVDFQRDSSGRVTEMHADIGGFLGLGETRVRVLPSEFTIGTDRVVLTKTAEQAKMLPKVVN